MMSGVTSLLPCGTFMRESGEQEVTEANSKFILVTNLENIVCPGLFRDPIQNSQPPVYIGHGSHYGITYTHCMGMRVWGSLVPRSFPPPVFDCLQYKMEGEGLGESHVRDVR